MFVRYLLILMMCSGNGANIFIDEDNIHVTTCVQNMILHWCKKGSHITYVDLNYNDDDVIQDIHNMDHVTVISRTTRHIDHPNRAYVVMIENYKTFKDEFISLTQDEHWKPNAYFVIVFREFERGIHTELFNNLLRLHIFHVVVLYASESSAIYTYNPFHNNSCGKMFQKIIQYDNCSQKNIENVYFNKSEKILKGCTFNVAVPEWPPFTITRDKTKILNMNGTEQYLMKFVSELEGFNLNYTSIANSEYFPIIDRNMTATGSLGLIQKGIIDINFGGMLLIQKRASVFSYIHGHHDYQDEILTVVKKAGPVPAWKNMYLEFTYVVWILLVITFIIYIIIFSILFRRTDKCYFVLVMWDLLLLHGHKLYSTPKVKYFIFQWVIFAFFINAFYQSNLTGMTTHLNYDYQISNYEDVNNYNIQPCISTAFRYYTKAITERDVFKGNEKICDGLLKSMRVVSKDYTKYTVVWGSVYDFHEFKFKDKLGKSLLYHFPKPESKIIYGIFFYKGFPKLDEMKQYAISLRENGLIDKHGRDLKHEISKTYYVAKSKSKAYFIFPWQVLVIGYGISTIAFVIELIANFIKRRRIQSRRIYRN